MRTKLLNESQDEWLYKNYRNMGNEELAEKLSKMVEKDVKRELSKLYLDLEEDNPFLAKQKVASRIRTLLNYKGISVDYVKRRARELGCGKKSALCKSRTNSRIASTAHWKRLMANAEFVRSPYEWFRTFRRNDQKIAKCEDTKKFNSLKSSLCNWNREFSTNVGYLLIGEWNKELLVGRIYAKSLYK